MDVNQEIKKYIEENILPMYNDFDKAHKIDHVIKVIQDSLIIAADHDVDINMVYVIAAYHNIGLKEGRENHEMTSGVFLANDDNLKKWFSDDQLLIMKEAVEDHRASNKHQPRSIYGMIVAEADRDISYKIILYRTLQYGLKHYPDLDIDQHFERVYFHIQDKYGENGYLKLWLHSKKNEDGMKEIREALRSKDEVRKGFEELYYKEVGTIRVLAL